MSRTIGLVPQKKDTPKDASKDIDKFEGFDVEQLIEYAKENGIDIGNSSSIGGITKKINEAEKAK